MRRIVRDEIRSAGGGPVAVVVIATFCCAVVTGACGNLDRSASTAAFTVEDSAGVRVVEYEGLPSGAPRWVPADSARLRLGTVAGGGPEQFGRVASGVGPSVIERSDGSLVVADRTAGEIRAFDSEGAHLWTSGRTGEGPGEFRRGIRGVVGFAGDSIAVQDLSGSVSVFDPSGRFRRQFEFAHEDVDALSRQRTLEGVLRDGTLVASAREDVPFVPGYGRADAFVFMYEADGSGERRVTRFRGEEYEYRGQGTTVTGGGRPEMAKDGLVAVGREWIATTDQDRFEVSLFSADGVLSTVLRVTTDSVVVDEALRSRYIDHAVRTTRRDDPAAYRAQLEGEIYPDVLPAIARIEFDAADRLWIQAYPTFEAGAPADWYIFDVDGGVVARASIPPELAVERFGEDHLIAVTRNAFDVEFVEVRDYDRSGGC